MADSEERKSAEAESESDDNEVAALKWTLWRMEASDDDDEEASDREEIKESYRSSSTGDDGGSCSLSVEPDYDGEASNRDELEQFGEKGSELEWEVIGELENISQDEDEVRDTVLVYKGKEKAESEEIFVPKSGWFYMHDDRSESRRYGHRRGTMLGVKLWDCKSEQKWTHDKFEDMTLQDESALKSHHQQGKNQSKDHRYANTNKFGSHGNFGYQNKTSRIVKGRGPIKYKPLLKRNLNLSSNHQIPAALQERTPNSGSQGVSSHMPAISSGSHSLRVQQFASTVDSALSLSDSLSSSSHGILKTRRSNEQYDRSDRYIPTSTQKNYKFTDSLSNSCLQMKTIYKYAGSDASNFEESNLLVDDKHCTYQPMQFPILAESLQVGGKITGLPFSTQQIYQPYSTHNNEHKISFPPLYLVIEQRPITSTIQTRLPLCSQQLTLHAGSDYQTLSKSLSPDSSVETLPQTSNVGIGLFEGENDVLQRGGRGSFQHGGTPAFLPVMPLGGPPCGAVSDHAPWILAPVEYVPQSQLCSRDCEVTSSRGGATKPCKINKPLADKSASQFVANEFRQRQLKPQRYSTMN